MERKIIRFPEGCAVTENGRLVEYIDLNDESKSGDIILAKIDRMMPGIDCAFADIGRKRDGFLPLHENSQSFTGGPFRSGDRIAVQIRCEESGGKGAVLSRDLTIPGRYIILMPLNRYTGVSSRIADERERERLRSIGMEIAEGRFGVVMRASARHAEENAIRAEAETLSETWKNIQEAMKGVRNPGDTLCACDPVAGLLRDYGAAEYAIEDEMTPEIRRELDNSANRTVRLNNGGNLVVDRCEAMTVIDVNSADARIQENKEETVTQVNMEACSEVAVQVRLRDISGIILIDFIDMDKAENRKKIEEKLIESFSQDRRKTVIHGWTKLGIMEMTRKRV